MRLALVLAILLLSTPLAANLSELTNSQRLFFAIARVENCRSWNNPGCLKFARQKGARRGPRGYAVFKTLALGRRALSLQIDRYKGMKVGHFLRKYNPGVRGYTRKVLAASSGLTDTDILD